MFEVKRSELHGKGLFAAEPIAKDTLLGKCKKRKTKTAGIYTLTLENGSMYNVSCDLKFINHSKQPNVSYYDDFTVMALRDIEMGEELVHDYGDEWDENGPIA